MLQITKLSITKIKFKTLISFCHQMNYCIYRKSKVLLKFQNSRLIIAHHLTSDNYNLCFVSLIAKVHTLFVNFHKKESRA